MKRSERHRLKENEIAASVAHAREMFARRQREVKIGVVVLLGLLFGLGGYLLWQQRANAAAAALLAEAMIVADAPVAAAAEEEANGDAPEVPPGGYASDAARLQAAVDRFLAAADAYPSTDAGIAARYHAAAGLAQLNRLEEARAQYEEVVARAGRRIYGPMARLGLAGMHAAAGRFEEAIEQYQQLVEQPEDRLPRDGVLMQLARAYARAGRPADAAQTFTRIVEEYPQSLYATEAQRELETLRAAAG